MRTLVVKQTAPNGANRTWRLRPDGKPVTLGSSRLAALTSVDAKSGGIDGVLECRDGRWVWIAMNMDAVNGEAVTPLDESSVVALAGSELRFGFHEKDDGLYRKLEQSTAAEPTNQSAAYELEIVKFGARVLSTKILRPGAKPSDAARTAKDAGGEKITVVRRPVHLGSVRELTKLDAARGLDREAKRGTAIVAVCSVLFAVAAVFGPRNEVTMSTSVPTSSQVVTMTLTPSKPKKAERKPASEPAPSQAAEAPKGGRVAGLLKAVNGGRLSQLLGKISAQAARSRSVIVQNGVKAGEGQSGRALAALGKVDRGGDWAGSAQGNGLTVSTAGRGGGHGTGGMGTLAAGNTGSAGVGLVEDESEITGGLDREIIAQTIKAYLGQILYCYERQLSASPDLFGKVAVRFTIGPKGAVETQKIGDTTLKNATVEGCILNKVAAWKFPAPQGGTKVMVTYPFLFKSTN